MTALKNFINKVLDDRRIYTAEDIAQMSGDEFSQNEKAINYQMNNLGIPRERDLVGNTDVVYVRAYTKDDGTKVKAHYRSKPDGINSNNSANQYRQSYRTNSTPTGAAASAADYSEGESRLFKLGAVYNDYPEEINISTQKSNNTKSFRAKGNKMLLDFGIDKLGNNLLHQEDAAALWDIASNPNGITSNNDYIKKNGWLYRDINSLSNEFSQYKSTIKEKVKKQFKTIDDAPGIVFHENSNVAYAMMESQELNNFIKEKFEDLKSGKEVSGSFRFSGFSNLRNAFGSVDVLSAKKKGNTVEIIILDTYDFNEDDTNKLVKMGSSVQKHGLLNPYFTIVKCKYKL